MLAFLIRPQLGCTIFGRVQSGANLAEVPEGRPAFRVLTGITPIQPLYLGWFCRVISAMDKRPRVHFLYSPCRGAVSGGSQRPRGFSLLDLLVSIAVMVVLIAILTPSLMSAHEAARRVRCAAHIQQLGYAIHMYADDMNGRLPPADYRPPNSDDRTSANNQPPTPPWSNDTIKVRFESLTPGSRPIPGGAAITWDGLGILYINQYVSNPTALYCPSHHGKHDYSNYKNEWVDQFGPITCNYQYRVPPASPFLAELNSWVAIMADGMATKSDYNHRIGNNYLRIDSSVAWYSDDDGSLFRSLPDDLETAVHENGNGQNWHYLDQPFGKD